MKKQSISVILPCYNECGHIISLIQKIHEHLHSYVHEIIVVDDNSPDGTYQLVRDANLEYVVPILRQDKPDFARSIREGLESAKYDVLVVMDSDFNHRPEDLPILIDNIEYFDCVIASRFVYGGKMNSRFRHRASWIFNLFVRIATKTYITDALFGYYCVRREVLQLVNYDDIFYGFGEYGIRLLYYLQKMNINILQIPGVLGKRPSGKGNAKFVKTLFIYTYAVLKLVFKSKRSRRHYAETNI